MYLLPALSRLPFPDLASLSFSPRLSCSVWELYFNGASRYDVLDDKIRTVGILGQRDLEFGKINAFEDALPESFTSRLQSFLTGAPLSSAIEVEADQSFFSQ